MLSDRILLLLGISLVGLSLYYLFTFINNGVLMNDVVNILGIVGFLLTLIEFIFNNKVNKEK
jgi:hypothetical protein